MRYQPGDGAMRGSKGSREGVTMFRQSLAFVVGLCLTSPLVAASWADGMFEELSKDFGSVPRGPLLSHPFRFTNNTGMPVHIAGVRVSCGCVSAQALETNLAPGQSTAILAHMDTRRFNGVKSVTIYVQLDQPRYEEVRLWVQANSRDDVTVTPDSLTFGKIKRGSSPSTQVNITFLGSSQLQIVSALSESNYVQTSLRELRRDMAETTYQLMARLRSDAPVGKWYSDVWLTTNNPATPRIRVPLQVEIESTLTVSPATVTMGQVKVGTQTQRNVIIRGVKPFRITTVKGTDAVLSVRGTSEDSKPVHVLTVTFQPQQAGEVERTLRVITDMREEGEIEFQARATVTAGP